MRALFAANFVNFISLVAFKVIKEGVLGVRERIFPFAVEANVSLWLSMKLRMFIEFLVGSQHFYAEEALCPLEIILVSLQMRRKELIKLEFLFALAAL